MANQFSAEYIEYINSDDWRKLCERLARKCGYRCQKCGKRSKVLQGHHLTYERLGHERDSDIQMVCLDCHPNADKDRKELKQRKSEQDEMFTWIEITYGKDYRKHYRIDDLVKVYYEWKSNRKWRMM